MNIHPFLTNIRSYLYHQFFTLRTNARREALWAKLMGKNTALALFPENAPEKSPNRKYNGIEDIPVEQIVGTINRQGDFDNRFRPLNKHLRERWVDVYLALDHDSWPPIVVHKVGNQYYVEDGHHRVSIAQALGMTFIQANVWEYPCTAKVTKVCEPEPCPGLHPARVYPGVAD